MSEQYDIAAWRHQGTGELLEKSGVLDDAGYHYGVAGENAVKYALQVSGVEAGWVAAGVQLRRTPMRKHFPCLQALCLSAQADILLYAQGRLSAPIAAHINNPSFIQRFSGWDINIRYADTSCTPIVLSVCERWRNDAVDLLVNLVI